MQLMSSPETVSQSEYDLKHPAEKKTVLNSLCHHRTTIFKLADDILKYYFSLKKKNRSGPLETMHMA